MEEARFAVAVAPAVIAAARAWKDTHGAKAQSLSLGRTTVSVQHEGRHRGHVWFALAGGVILGAATALLLAPRAGAENRAQVTKLVRRWPRFTRIPEAMRAARTAAHEAFGAAIAAEPGVEAVHGGNRPT